MGEGKCVWITPANHLSTLGYTSSPFLFYTNNTALLVFPAWESYVLILSFRLIVFDIMDWIKESHVQVNIAKAELLDIPARPSIEHNNTKLLLESTIKQPYLGSI